MCFTCNSITMSFVGVKPMDMLLIHVHKAYSKMAFITVLQPLTCIHTYFSIYIYNYTYIIIYYIITIFLIIINLVLNNIIAIQDAPFVSIYIYNAQLRCMFMLRISLVEDG